MTKRMKMVTMNVKLLLFFSRSSARLVAVLMRHSLVSMSCSRSSCTRVNVPSGRHSHRGWRPFGWCACFTRAMSCCGEVTHQKPVLQPHLLSDRQADMFRARYQRGQVLQLVVLVCRNTLHRSTRVRHLWRASRRRPGGEGKPLTSHQFALHQDEPAIV